MARKQYYELLKQHVDALRTDRNKMHRFGPPPTIMDLGDVFEHVYRTIQSEPNSSVRHAFKLCDLKLDNPFHWADLLRALCDLNFSSKQSTNRKRDSAFLKQLKRDRAQIRGKFPALKQEEQAAKIKAEFPDRYGHLKIRSIRRLFTVKAKRQSSPKRLISFKKRSESARPRATTRPAQR